MELNLNSKYSSINDLRSRAKKRVTKYAFEYLYIFFAGIAIENY